MQPRALALCMRRLGGSLGGRLGWLGALAVLLLFGNAAAQAQNVAMDAVRVLCWVAAGPAALSAARSPSDRDREDGIELMVAMRGVSPAALRRTRLVAAAVACAARVTVPALLVALTYVVVVGWRAGGVIVGAVVGGLLAGACIGLAGAFCGEVAGKRGRSLLVAVVLLPWIASDLGSLPTPSLVGAVDAGLSLLAEASRWS